ncbi:MAG: alpha/beta hydrolase [Thermofilum sp.]|nr:alpha/beta hydrolase [Thermofilum sp.]
MQRGVSSTAGMEIRRMRLSDDYNVSYRFLSRSSKKAVVLIHGNLSSSLIWEDLIPKIPKEFDVIAPDLRGFGDSSRRPIDATRGLRDFSDDVLRLMERLRYDHYIVAGHSLGGAVALQAVIDAPASVKISRLVLVDPMSPYGFGGTKDEHGTPCYEDYAGSGAGLVAKYNPDFLRLLREKYTGIDHPSAPANVAKVYFADDFVVSGALVSRLLKMLFSAEVGECNYPGDYVESPNWPYVAPGTKGVLNAMSPKYLKMGELLKVAEKPPVLWVHGTKDIVVSDYSLLDVGTLGLMGHIPGYPGQDKFPPQPMVSQIRSFLDEYVRRGGYYEKFEVEGAGHTPFVEKPELFLEKFIDFIM